MKYMKGKLAEYNNKTLLLYGIKGNTFNTPT